MVIYHVVVMVVMLVEIEVVLMFVITYIIGLLSITFFIKYRLSTSKTFVGYEGKFKEYEAVLVDICVRLDTLELRVANNVSQQSQKIRDVSDVIRDVSNVNHGSKTIQRNLEQGGKRLVNHVLELLVEKAKTSRQIETITGRSREHTARLMKKLFDLGYVTRETSVKPYMYALTDSGKAVLSQVSSVNSNA
ncbi:MAG: hypothetical protein EX285_03200 [Thaumarchaeota archaeon]|nr:hypothetical protein [Nitrososphaerota archaeon]